MIAAAKEFYIGAKLSMKMKQIASLGAATLALTFSLAGTSAHAAVAVKYVQGASCAAAPATIPITTTGGTVNLSVCVTTTASERVCSATYSIRSSNAAANAAAVQVTSRTVTAPFTNVLDITTLPATLTSTQTVLASGVPASGVQTGGVAANVKIADLTLTVPAGLPGSTSFNYEVDPTGEVATTTAADCNDLNVEQTSNAPGAGAFTLATPAAPSTAVFTISTPVNVTEGGATANATVTCTGAFASNETLPVSLAFTTTNAAGNFTTSASPLSFAACGGATQQITVTPRVDDAVVQGNVAGSIVLTAPAAGVATLGTPSTAVVNVLDNDTPPQFSMGANAGTCAEAAVPTNCSFQILRDSGVATATTVNFTVTGTATRGTDYTLKTGGCAAGTTLAGNTVSHPNASPLVIDVCVIDDLAVEGPETVIFTLNTGTGYTLGAVTSRTQSIADDDSPQVVTVAVSGSPATENGGVLTYTFTRSGGSAAAQAATLPVNITPPAASGRYTTTCASPITFAASTPTAACTVTGVNNAVLDGNVNVVVAVAAPTVAGAYTVGTPSSATGVIADDEVGVSVTASAGSVTEGGLITFTISCTGSASTSVPFTLTGTIGTDVIGGATSPVALVCGTPQTVTVQTLDDTIQGNSRSVTLTLGTPTGGNAALVPGASAVTVGVLDNDAPTVIPTMGVFGLGLMSLMLAGLAAFQRRRSMK
jgi:hypothetical protein